MIERVLRWSAIAIAAAALVDPTVPLSGRVRPRVAVVSAAGAASNAARDRLAESVQRDFEVVDGAVDGVAAMVFIGKRYPEITVPFGVPVSTVTLAAPARRHVGVAAIRAPARVPPHTAVPLEIDLDAAGASGATSNVSVSSGGVEVGRLSHTWHGDRERWHASLEVVPVGDPPFAIRARLDPVPGEPVAPDHDAAVLVDAAAKPLRVVAYEPRPSWAATFVRRALESDARFAVASVTDVSRGIDVRSGDGLSLAGAVAADAADVVVAGGLDRLSAADVRLLDRFMRERGGSVVLLPDGLAGAGPIRDLLPVRPPSEAFTDTHAPLTMAASLPRIDASEILTFNETAPEARVLARAADSNAPVIVVLPRGDGRLMFSGALDAWRSRAEKGVAFDRFWQAAIAGLALDTPPLVDVTLAPALPAAGDRVHVSVRVRGDAADAVSATVDDGEVVRLWPTAAAGAFTGTFTAPPRRGVHVLEVVAADGKRTTGRGRFVVGADATSIAPAAPLALLAASRGGIDVDADHLAALERHLRATIVPDRAWLRYRLMRSPWWLVLFAACLSGEWWLRRRRGRR